MPDLSTLREIASRLGQAEGPDGSLDVAIATTLAGMRDIFGDGRLFDRGNEGYWSTHEDDEKNLPLPCFTASVDAALALVERRRGHGRAQALLQAVMLGNWGPIPTVNELPIAILRAFVGAEIKDAALIARGEG